MVAFDLSDVGPFELPKFLGVNCTFPVAPPLDHTWSLMTTVGHLSLEQSAVVLLITNIPVGKISLPNICPIVALKTCVFLM